MRILFFTDFYRPIVTGVATSIDNFGKKLIEKGHDACVVCPDYSFMNKKATNNKKILKTIRVKSYRIYDELPLVLPNKKIENIIRKQQVDVIHVASIATLGFYGFKLAKKYKIPTILTFHGFFIEQIPLIKKISVIKNLLWKLTVIFCNKFDHIIAPTKSVKDVLINKGVSKQISVCPTGLIQKKIKKTKNDIAKITTRYNLGNKVILYTGRLHVEKNVDKLIMAFQSVVKEDKEVQLLIIGAGDQEKKLKKLVNKLKITEKVFFIEAMERDELINSAFYESSLIYATCSTGVETQCLSLIEAMSRGLPVIAFKCRVLEEVVGDGGVLVDDENTIKFAKTMLRLIKNKKLRQQLSEKAKKASKKYDMNHLIDKYIKIHKSCINIS